MHSQIPWNIKWVGCIGIVHNISIYTATTINNGFFQELMYGIF